MRSPFGFNLRCSVFSQRWQYLGEHGSSLSYNCLLKLFLARFFGAMVKSRGMVSSFAIAIAIHLGFSIAAGCFSIYTMFARDSQAALDSCLQKASDVPDAATVCKNGIILIKAVTVVIYVLTWLIQLC
jgi:hypothetical protein